MNGLPQLVRVLETGEGEVQVEESIRLRALQPIERMLTFTAAQASQQSVVAAAHAPGLGVA